MTEHLSESSSDKVVRLILLDIYDAMNDIEKSLPSGAFVARASEFGFPEGYCHVTEPLRRLIKKLHVVLGDER